ncbi:branched-chain amino acid ABC transporter permease [Archaeoglobus fulgidus]|nr:branched-chain amino acid ABC transporter permease [Archaeoglobus fulgidus]AIG97834.1 Branched-chain amino acid ABC-type transport system, permease component [Archaeoglobus fulgidus DSM 8774]KUJ93142.1 MAG: Branched-chain amino acid ABC transporter, permease protein (BraD-3) [Archaeoglobus fulgidus]KUK06806.1 MAG: Branched-chain amino acid ABC transporter, permease protein (BraD-3) [Archaeoglobus fulgidus]
MISAVFTAIFLSFFASAVILNYKLGRMLNLTFASLFTLGAYLYLAVEELSVLASLLAGFLVGAILSKLTERLSVGEATVVSLGFAIAIEELLRILFRSAYYQIVEASYLEFYGETLEIHEILNAAVLSSLLVVFGLILNSRRGLELKFMEEDWELAEIYGVRTERIRLIAVSLSSALVCLNGALLSPTHILHPAMGWSVMVVAVIVASLAAAAGNTFRKYAATFPIALAYSILVGWLP